jgi:DNA-binding FrmR family transcriptional regulator
MVTAAVIARVKHSQRQLDKVPPPQSDIIYIERAPVREMPHTIRAKTKLLNRVRRIRGQIEAAERALEDEKSCAEVLHIVVAARGAINSLVAEVIEDHIHTHVVDPAIERGSSKGKGVEQLIDVVQAYLR